jgi:hypothetical protein
MASATRIRAKTVLVTRAKVLVAYGALNNCTVTGSSEHGCLPGGGIDEELSALLAALG